MRSWCCGELISHSLHHSYAWQGPCRLVTSSVILIWTCPAVIGSLWPWFVLPDLIMFQTCGLTSWLYTEPVLFPWTCVEVSLRGWSCLLSPSLSCSPCWVVGWWDPCSKGCEVVPLFLREPDHAAPQHFLPFLPATYILSGTDHKKYVVILSPLDSPFLQPSYFFYLLSQFARD